MSFFSRPDGTLVKEVSPDRAIVPFILRGRNESLVYYGEAFDVSETRRWLRAFNRANTVQAATLFHLFIWTVGHAFLRHPQLNRFISGGRLYQRKDVSIGFLAKKDFDRKAPLITVKSRAVENEPLTSGAKRIVQIIREGRDNRSRSIDKELKLASRLPGPVLRAALWGVRKLDEVNLLPGFMVEEDPLFSTIMVANNGSIGLNNAFHHLYEYGNASFFVCLGAPRKGCVVSRRGQVETRSLLDVHWTMDERIADAYETSIGLRWNRTVIEKPYKFIGEPEAAAKGEAPLFITQKDS